MANDIDQSEADMVVLPEDLDRAASTLDAVLVQSPVILTTQEQAGFYLLAYLGI